MQAKIVTLEREVEERITRSATIDADVLRLQNLTRDARSRYDSAITAHAADVKAMQELEITLSDSRSRVSALQVCCSACPEPLSNRDTILSCCKAQRNSTTHISLFNRRVQEVQAPEAHAVSTEHVGRRHFTACKLNRTGQKLINNAPHWLLIVQIVLHTTAHFITSGTVISLQGTHNSDFVGDTSLYVCQERNIEILDPMITEQSHDDLPTH